MRSARPGAVIALLLALPAGGAFAAAAASAPAAVAGVGLSTLCEGCGVVADVRSEARDGRASGAVAVGVAGNAVEKNMNKHTVWITTVTFSDGSSKKYEAASAAALKPGDIVKIDQGHPVKAMP